MGVRRVWNYVIVHRSNRPATFGLELPSFDRAVEELRHLDHTYEIKSVTMWNELRSKVAKRRNHENR